MQVKEHMAPAYQASAEERGSGSFARMKAHMLAHVEREKREMFKDATGESLSESWISNMLEFAHAGARGAGEVGHVKNARGA